MSILATLFQASKAHLTPLARSLVSFLEILIITIVAAGIAAGGDYLTGHPNNISGIIPFVVSGVVIALGKAFTAFAPQFWALQASAMQQVGVAQPSVTLTATHGTVQELPTQAIAPVAAQVSQQTGTPPPVAVAPPGVPPAL